jgi:hypothetical protein
MIAGWLDDASPAARDDTRFWPPLAWAGAGGLDQVLVAVVSNEALSGTQFIRALRDHRRFKIVLGWLLPVCADAFALLMAVTSPRCHHAHRGRRAGRAAGWRRVLWHANAGEEQGVQWFAQQ